MFRRIRKFTLFCIALLGLSACATQAALQTREMLFPGETNLKEINYATADYMISQIYTYVSRYNDVIKVNPLVNIDQPTLATKVGAVVSGQVGERFAQLGYQMDLTDVTTTDEDVLARDSTQNKNPNFILSGHYQVADNFLSASDMNVNLRILDTRNGRIIATYDYVLPYTSQLRELGKAEPKIFKLPQSQYNSQ